MPKSLGRQTINFGEVTLAAAHAIRADMDLPSVSDLARYAITVVTASSSGADDLRKTEVIVTLAPPVQTGQRVVLLLNRVGTVPVNEPRAYSFSAKSPNTSTSMTFSGLKGVNAAVYLVRVQVDGAESPLGADAAGAYDFPKVTIP